MNRRHFMLTSAASVIALQATLLTPVIVADSSVSNTGTNVKGTILLVASSPTTANNGWPMGAWAAEITHPYDELVHAGYNVEIVSTQGGEIVLDGYSDPRHESGYSASDIVSLGFLSSLKHKELLTNTRSLNTVNPADYVALIVAGGQAPMYTFRKDKNLQNLIRAFYEAHKPTAALCHGVAALVDVKLSNGAYLLDGKTATGFSLAEDKFAEEATGATLFDWYVEPAMKERGANYVQGGMWADFAVQDGNLITGQQQHSGRSVARLIIEQLKAL